RAAAGLRARAAGLALTRADLLGGQDRHDEALADYERAFALSGEADAVRLAAARALAAAARNRHDGAGERRWIGAQLAHPNLDRDRGPLLVRRAELALDTGEDLAAALADVDQALGDELPADARARALR